MTTPISAGAWRGAQRGRAGSKFARLAARFRRNEVAAVAPMMALMLLPVSGTIAIAVEQGQWYYFQRSMQNAADSAALAAAINNSTSTAGYTSGAAYSHEAAAAARGFGYVNGVNQVQIATTNVCPAGVTAPTGTTCYQTTISTFVKVGLSALVGFHGSEAANLPMKQKIVASAVAVTGGAGQSFCIWTLSPNDDSLRSNGGPKPDLNGCALMSNGNATCNGHNLGASYGYAAGNNNNCGITQVSGAPVPANPFTNLATNLPSDSCAGKYPSAKKSGNKYTVETASNQLTGSKAWTGNQQFCGDVQLTGNVTLTGTSTTVVIRNGMLDLNGFAFKTASGATATVVFTGTGSGGAYGNYPTSMSGGGTLDVKAPTSGAWSGVAVFQDPALTGRLDFTYAGNQPTWNISGLVYLPKANVTFSGAVGKSSSGSSCFLLITYTLLINGTGNIFANNTECASAGLTPPASASGRPKLVR